MRAFVRPHPGALDVRAEAHADVVAVRPRAEYRQRSLEQRRVVAAVVHGAVAVLPGHADLIRKLVWLDEIAAADLDAVEAELGRDGVERALHHEARMRPACPPIGR